MNTYSQADQYIYLLYRKTTEVSYDSKEMLKEKKQSLGHSMRKKDIFEGFVRSYYSQTNV